MNKEISIIVFFQLQDTADLITGILKPNFPKIYPVNINTDLYSPFEHQTHKKVLFLYAIEDIELAKMTCLSLYKNTQTKAIREIWNSDFLLCRSSDSKLAYDLCINNIFDDFIIMKPMYDHWGFLLHITRCIERMELQNQLFNFEVNKGHIKQKVNQLDNSLENLSHRYGNIGKEFHQKIQKSISQIDTAINDLIIPTNATLDQNELNAFITQVQQTIIENHLTPLLKNNDIVFQGLTEEINNQLKTLKYTQEKELKDKRKHKSVLVADDHRVFQQIVFSVLEPQGYQVSIANDGLEVMQKAIKEVPDLILMDINMPNKNGLEALKAIKLHPGLNNVKVIMITNYGDKKHLHESLQAGAVDYIVKPTKATILLQKVKKALNSPIN